MLKDERDSQRLREREREMVMGLREGLGLPTGSQRQSFLTKYLYHQQRTSSRRRRGRRSTRRRSNSNSSTTTTITTKLLQEKKKKSKPKKRKILFQKKETEKEIERESYHSFEFLTETFRERQREGCICVSLTWGLMGIIDGRIYDQKKRAKVKIFIHSSLNYIIFLLFIISSKNSFFTFLGLLNFTLTISSIIVVAVFFVYKKFQ